MIASDEFSVVKNNGRFKIETPQGFVDFDGVAKIDNPQPILHIILENDDIFVSPEHEFVFEDETIFAKELVEGMEIETKSGLQKVLGIGLKPKSTVYDILEIHNLKHTYIANEIVNHNCRFLGSSNTLIDPDVLERIDVMSPKMLKWNGSLQIFFPPEAGAEYILGIDPGKGTRRDYSVIQILRIFSEKNIEQVAIYRNNEVDTHVFAQVCISVSDFFNKAEMMIENNGCGEGLLNTIWYEYECDRVVNCEKKGLGVNANKKSKLAANLNTKRYIEEGWCKIHDQTTVYELSRFIEHKLNVFACETKDGHDDTVTSLNWGLWYPRTSNYTGKRTVKKLQIEDKFKLTNEEMESLPAAIVNEEEENNDPLFWRGEGY